MTKKPRPFILAETNWKSVKEIQYENVLSCKKKAFNYYVEKSLEIEEDLQNESNIVFRLSDLSVFYIDDNQYSLVNTGGLLTL